MNILIKVLKFVFYYFPLGLLSVVFEEKDRDYSPNEKVRGVKFIDGEVAGHTDSKHSQEL